jgi:hypothetical protein
MSPDMNAKVQLWRDKARNGTLTQDEMKEAITALRTERQSIGAAKGVRGTAKKIINSEDLLSELDNL